MRNKRKSIVEMVLEHIDDYQYVPPFSNKDMILERQGIWTYSPDVRDYKTTHLQLAEYIYYYIRKMLFAAINEYPKQSMIFFTIPEEILKVPVILKSGQQSEKKLIPFRTVYNVNNHNEGMSIEVSEDFKSAVLYINMDYDASMFKPTLIHELKHLWQSSFIHSRFNDRLAEMRRSECNNNKEFPKELDDLMDYVYRYNPDEFESYREQIYSLAYEYHIQNPEDSIHKATRIIKKYFKYNDSSIEDIKNICKKYHRAAMAYFMTLYLNNVKCPDGVRRYRIFSDKMYYEYYGREFKIVMSHLENQRQKDTLINNISNQILDANPKFTEKLIEDAINNLEKLHKKYDKEIARVVYAAFEDAERYLKDDTNAYSSSNSRLYKYISYNTKDDTAAIDIIIKYKEKDEIKEKLFQIESSSEDGCKWQQNKILKKF